MGATRVSGNHPVETGQHPRDRRQLPKVSTSWQPGDLERAVRPRSARYGYRQMGDRSVTDGGSGAERPTAGEAPDAEHWRRRLSTLARRHQVPGAVLGVLQVTDASDPPRDHLVEVACGVLNTATGVSTTVDSLFQIGSVSKVWTATAVMQLVDEGALELDQPIIELLPELRLGDPEVARGVTMRHLLGHTSGIDGDIYTDTGRGDDCLTRYVALLAEAGQNHPLGATWSYCNSGYVLAGRVIENLTGRTWDAAMRERLFEPLGLKHTVTLPEEALLFRAAVGHLSEPDQDPRPCPVWMVPRSLSAAGGIVSTARDVLTFARLHLSGGLAANGTCVLSAQAVDTMQAEHITLPDQHSFGDSWGLGWDRRDWDGRRVLGHDGSTLGQAAFLRVLPGAAFAAVLLTNGGHAGDLYQDLFGEVFASAGIEMAHPLVPPPSPPELDPEPYLGRYERTSSRLEVLAGDAGLILRSTDTSPFAELQTNPVEELDLVPVREHLFTVRKPNTETWTPVTFYRLPDGMQYLHIAARAHPKVS